MKAFYILAAAIFISFRSLAQTDSTDKVFTFVEQMPEFPGGNKAITSFIAKNVVYPEYEQTNNIQGRVVLKFVVDTDGSVKNVEIIKAISPGIDSEAVRVVRLLPKFTPGMQQGKPVKVYFNLPVSFKLTEPVDKDSSIKSDSGRIYQYVDQQPIFPGGDLALIQFQRKNINYPKSAKQKGIEGKVLLRFVVNVDGSVSDVTVVKHLDPDMDAEAIRVVKLLPKFAPGKKEGKPVKVYFNLPVIFRLSNSNR